MHVGAFVCSFCEWSKPVGCGRSWSEGDCNLERGTSRVDVIMHARC